MVATSSELTCWRCQHCWSNEEIDSRRWHDCPQCGAIQPQPEVSAGLGPLLVNVTGQTERVDFVHAHAPPAYGLGREWQRIISGLRIERAGVWLAIGLLAMASIWVAMWMWEGKLPFETLRGYPRTIRFHIGRSVGTVGHAGLVVAVPLIITSLIGRLGSCRRPDGGIEPFGLVAAMCSALALLALVIIAFAASTDEIDKWDGVAIGTYVLGGALVTGYLFFLIQLCSFGVRWESRRLCRAVIVLVTAAITVLCVLWIVWTESATYVEGLMRMSDGNPLTASRVVYPLAAAVFAVLGVLSFLSLTYCRVLTIARRTVISTAASKGIIVQ
jgi:hypothetical protein